MNTKRDASTSTSSRVGSEAPAGRSALRWSRAASRYPSHPSLASRGSDTAMDAWTPRPTTGSSTGSKWATSTTSFSSTLSGTPGRSRTTTRCFSPANTLPDAGETATMPARVMRSVRTANEYDTLEVLWM